MAAASRYVMLGGMLIRWSVWTEAYCAYPPPESMAITLLAGSLWIYPAHSRPSMLDAPAGGG